MTSNTGNARARCAWVCGAALLAAGMCWSAAAQDRFVQITFVNQSSNTRSVDVAAPGRAMEHIGSFRPGGVVTYTIHVPTDQTVRFRWKSKDLGGWFDISPDSTAYMRIDLGDWGYEGPY